MNIYKCKELACRRNCKARPKIEELFRNNVT